MASAVPLPSNRTRERRPPAPLDPAPLLDLPLSRSAARSTQPPYALCPFSPAPASSPRATSLSQIDPNLAPSPRSTRFTINRPDALNAPTRSMMISLASAFRRLHADDGVVAVVLAGRGHAFCSGADLQAAEEIFKDDVNDPAADPVKQMERCSKPIVGAVVQFAVTAGFEITLACDIIVSGRSAKFLDTHAMIRSHHTVNSM